MTRQFGMALGMVVAASGVVALGIGHAALAADRGTEQRVVVADKPAPAPDTQAAPSELAREGMAKMLQALNKLIESVPQFEMPEMNENGDIILRRKRPDTPSVRPTEPQQPPSQEDLI